MKAPAPKPLYQDDKQIGWKCPQDGCHKVSEFAENIEKHLATAHNDDPNEVMDVEDEPTGPIRSSYQSVTKWPVHSPEELKRLVAQQNAALLRSLLHPQITLHAGKRGQYKPVQAIPASILEAKLKTIEEAKL
ncbi:hypothetical protein ACFU44_13865 [Nocardia rhizosphaerihabitans]|uniref:hypothetical protein n=1 Tax=Nocardia rhizosphaerihabitans TaxID=1691570 RepID=UPI00366FE257